MSGGHSTKILGSNYTDVWGKTSQHDVQTSSFPVCFALMADECFPLPKYTLLEA